MKQSVKIEQLQEELVISNNSFLGTMNITYKGEKANKVSRFKYSLVTETGETLNISLKRKLGGIDMPSLTINNEPVIYVRPLNIMEMIILLLPISFLFFGLIGGLFAAFTFMITINNTRTYSSPVKSGIINIAFTLGMFVLVLIITTFVFSWIEI